MSLLIGAGSLGFMAASSLGMAAPRPATAVSNCQIVGHQWLRAAVYGA
jgi:hypothetical protein